MTALQNLQNVLKLAQTEPAGGAAPNTSTLLQLYAENMAEAESKTQTNVIDRTESEISEK